MVRIVTTLQDELYRLDAAVQQACVCVCVCMCVYVCVCMCMYVCFASVRMSHV
jgi:hypothetical protein